MARATKRANPKTLRLLAFSDCRVQDVSALLKRLRSAPPFDLIVYAGDDVRRFRPEPSTNWFERLAAEARFGLLAVIGNDDEPASRRLIAGKKVHELHTKPVKIGAFLFVGLDGAAILEQGPNPGFTLHSERSIAKHLRSAAAGRFKGTIVVVSHPPPRGCLDESVRFGIRQVGSTSLRRFAEQDSRVALIVCGHAHLCGGRAQRLGAATVVNIASHDDRSAPLRFASITQQKPGSGPPPARGTAFAGHSSVCGWTDST